MTTEEPQSAPLILTAEVRDTLHQLREHAARKPVDMLKLPHALQTLRGERLHREQMTKQTVEIPGPWPFFVTFSIETGHGAGVCRHMSMSAARVDRAPHPVGLWMVAEELGFAGGLEDCGIWPEPLQGGGVAINVIQPLAVQTPQEGSA